MKKYLKMNEKEIDYLFIHHNRNTQVSKFMKVNYHFKFAFQKVFSELKFDICIVLEDDLIVTGDFFSYFLQSEKLILNDQSIFSINGMNHHSHKDISFSSYNFYRMEAFNT